ncbi:MaoC family dehydratase [Providencia rettgeri]
MRTLRYTLDDAKQWASFSGDDNPIHFDLEWVKAKGGDQLSVHGMRALLDVKQFASESLNHQLLASQEVIDSEFIKCVVRLRNPLWNDKDYQLVARNKAGSVALLSSDEQQNCLTCQLSVTHPPILHEIANEITISTAEMVKLQSIFSQFSNEMYEWQFIDAVLFWYLIHDSALFKQQEIAQWLLFGSTLKDIFCRYPIVQTHQEMVFDRELLTKWVPITSPEPIYLRILPALVIADSESGRLVSISIAARYREKIINNSITLKVNSITQ